MAGKYEVSIVTPFHNVNIDFFKRGVESIKNQDIGFDKIEWIVVVHNSEKHYEEEVQELLSPYENVVVKILHNDKKTPSSPRNYGMDLATAKYIGFLDADDYYLPDCMSKVVRYMKEEEAQIATFRREYELENENAFPITEITLWNQTKEKIVLDRDSWDEEKMFSGLVGMITSKLFDREFLVNNNLRFDEDILFAEDYLFFIESYHYAKRVMYLPQLIGYHYFINGGSLVQSGIKDGPTLISYAKGYTKIFEKGLGYGFYMNNIMTRLCFTLSRFMVSNDALTYEDRVVIRDLLEKYINMTTELKENKLFSKKLTKDMHNLPREVILQPQKWANGEDQEALVSGIDKNDTNRDVMNSTLAEILEENVSTDIGQQYGFESIMTVQGFKSKVPTHSYDYYLPLIKLTTKIGESQIFTNEKVQYYTIAASSNGEQRLFPHVDKEIRAYKNAFGDMVRGRNTFLVAESLPRKIHFNDQGLVNSILGMALASYESDACKDEGKGSFSSPNELLFPERPSMTEYVRLLFALLDPTIDQIFATSTWSLLVTCAMIEYRWKTLCDDMENGTLGLYSGLDDDLAVIFNKRLKNNPQRAAELRSIFSEGFDTPVLKRIWPNLNRLIAYKLPGDAVYENLLRRYSGDIERIQGYLFCNGMVLGKETDVRNNFVIIPENGFYEFKQGDNIFEAGEVVTGEEYEVIVTTYSGLYRYETGKVVRIEGFDGKLPIFRCSYDIGNAMEIPEKDGKKSVLTPAVLADALVEVSKELRTTIADFTYVDRNYDKNTQTVDMLVIIEPPIIIGREQLFLLPDAETIREKLDLCLKKQSREYARAVDSGILTMKVAIGEPETNFVYCSRNKVFNDLVQDLLVPAKYLNSEEAVRFFTGTISV